MGWGEESHVLCLHHTQFKTHHPQPKFQAVLSGQLENETLRNLRELVENEKLKVIGSNCRDGWGATSLITGSAPL